MSRCYSLKRRARAAEVKKHLWVVEMGLKPVVGLLHPFDREFAVHHFCAGFKLAHGSVAVERAA
jgi:hypothetical protein